MSAPASLRLATWNIQHGRGADGTAGNARRLARAAATIDADILALQEVDVGQPRSRGADQAAIVAEAAGMRWHRFAAAIEGDVRGARARARTTAAVPGYGVALLSRHPVVAWFAHPLPSVPRWLAAGEEPRVLLAAVVRSPLGPIAVACTHLSRLPPVALTQLGVARRRLAGLAATAATAGRPVPAALLGDLNLRPGAVALSGLRGLASVDTFPTGAPDRQIDHVLALGGLIAADGATASGLDVGDHRLLAVDVRLANPLPGPDRGPHAGPDTDPNPDPSPDPSPDQGR